MPNIYDMITEQTETEDVERAQRYSDLWLQYDGAVGGPLAEVRTRAGDLIDDNVQANLCGTVVDRSVSFLFGDDETTVLFAVPDDELDDPELEAPGDSAVVEDDETEGEAATGYLEEVWGENLSTTLHRLGVNGGVTGHTWGRILFGALDEVPRVQVLDPAYCSAYWNPDNFEEVWGFKVQYSTVIDGIAAARRLLFELDDGGQFWTTYDEVATAQADGKTGPWTSLEEPVSWPHEFAPIFHCQNLPRPNEFYGKSDLEGGVADLNDDLDLTLSNMERLLRLHGHPKPWTAGVSPEQIAVLQQGADRIITLPEGAELNQLEIQGNPQGWVEFYRLIKTLFHEVARSPQVDPEKLGSLGGLSGVALRIMYQPALEKNGTKRMLYGDMLRDVCQRLLALGQFGAYKELAVSVSWPAALPQNEAEEASLAIQDHELGASKQTLLEKRGYDPDLESERRAIEREESPIPVIGNVDDDPDFSAGAVA